MNTSTLEGDALSQYEFVMNEIQPFVNSGAYDQALSRLSTILEGVPAEGDYKLLRGAFLARRADFYLELQDENAAWEDAQSAMNFGWYNAAVYSIAGWAMYHLDKPELALEQFTQSIALDENRIQSLMGRAMVHVDDEEYDLARVDLSKIIQLDPTAANALATRAEVSIYLETLNAAKTDIEKARVLDPKDPDFGLLAARLKYVESDYAGAKKILDETIQEKNEVLEALLLRSHLYLLEKEFKQARRDAIKATNLFPEEAICFVQLALVQYASESNTLAKKAADQAIELDSTLADAFYIRALVHKSEKDEENSKADFDRVGDIRLELADFLFGPLSARFDSKAFFNETLSRVDEEIAVEEAPKKRFSNPFSGGLPPIPGMGGMDPTKMLDQVFDKDGNVKPMFKPMLKMMMKNAPAMMKNAPPSMLKKMGNVDPEALENFDPSELNEDQIEEQLKTFYKMVKSGKVDFK